jgi:hypothetical protein
MSEALLRRTSDGIVPHARTVNVRRGARSAVVAVVAAFGLLLLSGFLWTKIAFNEGGTGWLYLPAFGACVVFVVVVRAVGGAQLVFSHSAPWLALFVFWFLIRLVLDAATISDVWGYTIGYGEGIFFAVGVGVAIRLLLDALSESASGALRWWTAMLLLAFNAWSAIQVEQAALAAGNLHRLYSYFYNDTYQLSGALMSVQAVIVAALLARSVNHSARLWARIAKLSLLVSAVGTFATMARLAQLLGSNSAPAFMVPVAIVAIAVSLIAFGGSTATRSGEQAGALPGFRGRLVAVCVASVMLGAFVAAAFLMAVASEGIDLTRYRAFGFDEASLNNSSIDSRFELLAVNFGTHLAHSPVLGNFFVDRLTTGEGSYAHGLVAVLPHLGIVGAFLFICMLIGVGHQLRMEWRASLRLPSELRFVMLAALLIAWTLGFMLLTTFFTNILLWMTLGLLAPVVRLRDSTVP